MAFRDLAHATRVYTTPEYRRMSREWVANKSPVPLAIFQRAYGNAFFDRKGKPEKPGRTETSRTAFLNLMIWTGRAPSSITWDEWEQEADRSSP